MSLPARPTIHFAHSAYRLAERFQPRNTGLPHFQTWTAEDTRARLGEADVLVLSGFWRNDMLEGARRLKLIQCCAAGIDQFDQAALRARGIRLASASGANANAVSEHAIALLLAFTRQLHTGRDHQKRGHWRGMISEIGIREEELPGKTLLLVGLGRIGGRIAMLAQAFGMHVIGVRRDFGKPVAHVDEIVSRSAFASVLPRADAVVLACPLNDDTRRIIDRAALSLMKPTACLINVARGGCVDEAALIEALQAKRIAGAGLDVTDPEPPAAGSPLWSMENVLLTSHTGGETRAYEENVVDILIENLGRLAAGEGLRNGVV
jgi:phosphoglycerate dehydrogenase-like enzyme